jgi:hypothetical protein
MSICIFYLRIKFLLTTFSCLTLFFSLLKPDSEKKQDNISIFSCNYKIHIFYYKILCEGFSPQRASPLNLTTLKFVVGLKAGGEIGVDLNLNIKYSGFSC